MITFIVPSIGRDTLGRTLQSLIQQTDPEWTCMVVMDGVDIPHDLPTDERIKYMRIEKTGERNHGGRVRNAGMRASTDSIWFAFVDDDDTVTSDYVEKLKKSIHQMPDVEVFIFRMMIWFNNILPFYNDTDFTKEHVGISFTIKASIFREDKLYFEPSCGEDYDFLDRVRTAGKNIHILPYICYYVRQNASVNGLIRCVYLCWFGDQMSSTRFTCVKSILKNIKVPVIYIALENYKNFELPDHPYHEGFSYLRNEHKADYIRSYVLYHYGGGYHDIKHRTSSWEDEWEKDNWTLDDNIWIYGRTERHPEWIAYPPGGDDIRPFYASLVSMNYIIAKRHTPFLRELLDRIHEILDEKLDRLRAFPFPHNEYPLRWCEILGEIYHPLMLHYKDHIKHGLPYVDDVPYK
jgi:glycosyltransferase involved in cell wall biosynthesis